ncbi:MAG: cyclic nucleotide-binding domain-containing protein [Pseudobacteriovorax sp.]|nr:cyclic nucleotide-binding domain-containing protein [Pseudobacteriovorax sp.]
MEGEARSFNAGQIIFREGDEGGSFYLIESGSVEVFKESDQGEVPLVCLGVGELLGLLTFFGDNKRLASARARTDITTKYVVKNDKVFPQLPKWVHIVLKEFASRLQQVNTLYSYSVHDSHQKGVTTDPLLQSSQIASLAVLLSDKFKFTQPSGKEVVPLQPLFDKIKEVLGYPNSESEQTINVLVGNGLLSIEKDPDSNAEVTSFERLQNLDWYVNFVRLAKSGKVKKMIENYPPFKDRKVLINLYNYATKQGVRPDKTASLDFETLVTGYQDMFKSEVLPSAIEFAKAHSLIEVLKKDGSDHLVFNPDTLIRTVVSLNVIHKLLQHPDARGFEEAS